MITIEKEELLKDILGEAWDSLNEKILNLGGNPENCILTVKLVEYSGNEIDYTGNLEVEE